jgi:hypothetical protein
MNDLQIISVVEVILMAKNNKNKNAQNNNVEFAEEVAGQNAAANKANKAQNANVNK